jgi:two-component system, cell cycle sensor histidine kinase and response regulator CckA
VVVSGTAHATRARWLLDVLAVAMAYIVASLLRLVFPFTEHGASWVWLPSGIALASLLLLGRDRWPGVLIGAFVSSILSDKQWTPAIVAGCYAPGEALLAYAIATRGGGFECDLSSVRSVLRLFLAAVVASAFTALIGAWNVGMLTPVPDPDYARAWLTFFVGDALGMLAVAPPLLVWGSTRVRFQRNWQRIEFAGLLVVAFVIGTLVFAQPAWPPNVVLPVAYATFPIMVWSAFRFGQPGVTAVIVVLGTLTLAGSARGFGPFAHTTNRGEALMLAAFLNVIAITAIILAALVQERARAQAGHRSAEARFRSFMRFTPAVAFMKSVDGRYVYGNEAWAAQFGKPLEDVIGKTDLELWPPDTAAGFQASDRQVLETAQPFEATVSGLAVDGMLHWWTTLKFVVEQPGAGGGRLVGGISIDVTARLRAEYALRASEDRYRSVVELAGSVIVILDEDNRIVEFNRAAEAFYGLPRNAAIGKEFLQQCVPAGEREQVRGDLARARGGEAIRDRETQVVTDGANHSFLWNASQLVEANQHSPGILVIGQDISELRRLETQLLLSQRMEGIGRLAGGIAHDFNNLLTAILGHAEMARTDVAPGDPALVNIAEITRAAQRAADLTRQLLAFARRQIIEPRIVDLNGLVLNVDKMLQRLLGEDVELVTVADPKLWHVRIDPGQFEQVLVNLAVNARDAMPEGGRLLIETGNVELDGDFARQHATVQPGPHVLLAVTDTGSGMDPDVLAHIFEPFFTTKEVGKGTGLGLATCYGIVKQNRGSIWVYSELGRGTTFKIYLPRTDAAVESREAPEPSQADALQSNETVLLVEDEPVVRTLAADALRRHGFQVLTASTGTEALELADQTLRPFDVLVTDVVMPQMGGQQLAEHLRAQTPALKVLFISGYTDSVLTRDGVLKPGMTLLQKPFTPGQLVQRVRDLIDLGQRSA